MICLCLKEIFFPRFFSSDLSSSCPRLFESLCTELDRPDFLLFSIRQKIPAKRRPMPSTINRNSRIGAIFLQPSLERILDAGIILPKVIRFLSNWQGPFRKIRKEPRKTQDIPFSDFRSVQKKQMCHRRKSQE